MTDIVKWKKNEDELALIVNRLKKTTTLSELLSFNEKRAGILIKFWRTYYPNQSKFPEWMTWMESKEPIIEKPKVETESERVDRELREIQEKYGD